MTEKVAVVLSVVALLSARCSDLVSGTWDDDPKNWGRAFHSTKPPEVIVVHSRYWRSPHWSYEFQYFFEIAPNSELKHQLFTANKLREVTGNEAVEARARVFGDAPSWFAPKSLADYEVWVSADEPGRNFKVLIDRVSGHIFINDYQV
jgi:hypothetical protein